jgi:hypothetical protein
VHHRHAVPHCRRPPSPAGSKQRRRRPICRLRKSTAATDLPTGRASPGGRQSSRSKPRRRGWYGSTAASQLCSRDVARPRPPDRHLPQGHGLCRPAGDSHASGPTADRCASSHGRSLLLKPADCWSALPTPMMIRRKSAEPTPLFLQAVRQATLHLLHDIWRLACAAGQCERWVRRICTASTKCKSDHVGNQFRHDRSPGNGLVDQGQSTTRGNSAPVHASTGTKPSRPLWGPRGRSLALRRKANGRPFSRCRNRICGTPAARFRGCRSEFWWPAQLNRASRPDCANRGVAIAKQTLLRIGHRSPCAYNVCCGPICRARVRARRACRIGSLGARKARTAARKTSRARRSRSAAPLRADFTAPPERGPSSVVTAERYGRRAMLGASGADA